MRRRTGPGSVRSAVPAAGSRTTVLVADDHPIFRDGLVGGLSSRPDLQVVGVVSDGRAALEAVRADPPDVALLDVRLPELTGIEVTNALRRDALPTRVVLISAFATPATVYEGIEAGAQAFVSKDADREEVADVIAAVARGEVRLPAVVQQQLVGQIQLRREERPLLTEREAQVLRLVAEGRSAPEIGRELFLGTSTVKTHLLSLYGKLEVADRAAAVATAMRLGLLE